MRAAPVALCLLFACARSQPTTLPAATGGARDVPAGALDPALTSYPYPYPVSFHQVRAQQQTLTMAYLDVAPTGTPNARIVLLLHGKNFSAAYWAPTIAALAADGF